MYDEVDTTAEKTDSLQKIIGLQIFEGYWNLVAPLLIFVGLSAHHKASQGMGSKVWATVLAITLLEGKMAGDKEVWKMVVETARERMKDMQEGEEGLFEEKWTFAEHLVMGAD